MSKRYKGAILSSTPPTTSTSSASGVWTEQQFMQGVASGSWPALAGAPTIGTATAGALSASVTFTAPTYTGSGITGYTVTSSPGSITGTGVSSPITVSGLTAGTSYTFTVTATTAAGQSSPSAASNSVTPTAPNYIEDVYSTYLYTGNGSTQTITNNINLSSNGGLVWIKARNTVDSHRLFDTSRGVGNYLVTNGTFAQLNNASSVTAFNSDGFSLGNFAGTNDAFNYASWTFRKQAKFFDVVTFTTPSSGALVVNHSLGSTPGFIVIKDILVADNWICYHRYDNFQKYFYLNTTDAAGSGYPLSSATDTTVTVNVGVNTNANRTYVMYLFAHNAGGFGLTGTDNVISCGSFTATGGATVDLGYEPQWILLKRTDIGGDDWKIWDTMRGWSQSTYAELYPNTSAAEASGSGNYSFPTATGFRSQSGWLSGNYIYIAIRRGPMKVPTDATKVYNAIVRAGSGTATSVTGFGFPPDLLSSQSTNVSSNNPVFNDRLRGAPQTIATNTTGAEFTSPALLSLDQNGFSVSSTASGPYNSSGQTNINRGFCRAPSFFDEVCYTGTGSNTTYTHNLTVSPELIISKTRSSVGGWRVMYDFTSTSFKQLELQLTDATAGWNYTDGVYITAQPTNTTFKVGTNTNNSGTTFVTYLFATCPGVSKVGSYTGNGTTQTIDCGFTGGARFVLIKRTDATGDWYVYDTARGMTTLTDPYLRLNSTAAETATLGSVTTVSTGFAVNASILAAINTNGASYIFLAIA